MTKREKFFKTIRREEEGYIPFDFSLCPSLEEKSKKITGGVDYRDYYNLPLRFIEAHVRDKRDVFLKYHGNLEKNIIINEWGVGFERGSIEHFTRMKHPMQFFEDISEFQAYPYPDANDDYDWESLRKTIKELKERDLIVAASMPMTIFEIAWYLRGMENFMVDMLTEPDIAEYHLDRITSIRCQCAIKYAELGVDILHVGDDVGTQLDMMIEPKMWEKFLKFRLKKVIDSAKEINPDILIDYHSDGNIMKIIPSLIEIGVDILNPVQPECIKPEEVKKLYGDRLSFRGTIGTQTTMPFGTCEEVEKVCENMIHIMGKGGGFILSPTHILEPEVPWENIEAMINTVKKYSL